MAQVLTGANYLLVTAWDKHSWNISIYIYLI